MSELHCIPPSKSILKGVAVFIRERLNCAPQDLPSLILILPTQRSKRTFQTLLYEVYEEATLLLPRLYTAEDIFKDPRFIREDLQRVDSEEAIGRLASLLLQKGMVKTFPEALEAAEEILDVHEEMEERGIPLQNLKNLGTECLSLHRQDSLTFLTEALELWQRSCAVAKVFSSSAASFDLDLWAASLGASFVFFVNGNEEDPLVFKMMQKLGGREKTFFFKIALPTEKTPQDARNRLCRALFDRENDIPEGPFFEGVAFYEVNTRSDEAYLAALLLREAYENGGKTALVTGDRSFAVRVREILRKWELFPDDASGTTLSLLPVGSFVKLLLTLLEAPEDIVSILSFLKHPLVRFEWSGQDFYRSVESLEMAHRCGEKPTDEAYALKQILRETLQGFNLGGGKKHPSGSWVQALERSLTRIMAGTTARREEREALSSLLENFSGKSTFYPPLSFSDFKQLLLKDLSRTVVRSSWQVSPGLYLWEPRQALDQPVDLLILSGFHEGEWPQVSGSGMFLSTSMRRDLALPTEKEWVSFQEKALMRLMAAPRIIFTVAQRDQSAPLELSRWGRRLKAVARISQEPLPSREEVFEWLSLRHQISEQKRLGRPHPKPPAAFRPKAISATDVEQLLSNPYIYYVNRILGLRELPSLRREMTPLLYGTAVHKVLELLAQSSSLQEDFDEAFRKAFRDVADDLMVQTFWYARLKAALTALEESGLLSLPTASTILAEIKGEIELDDMVLRARVDRLEVMPWGSARLIDFKTGALPTRKMVYEGFSLQLALEALILYKGGFRDVPPNEIERLAYIRLIGGEKGIECLVLEEDIPAIAKRAEEILKKTFIHFSTPSHAYFARASKTMGALPGTSSHLVRGQEWLNNPA